MSKRRLHPFDEFSVNAGPRIAFVGAGAIGGYVGGHLFRAGYDVTLIDQWPEHVDAIKARGIRYSGTSGEYAVRVPAMHIHEVQSLLWRPVQVAFICTKLYDTAWATMLIKPYLRTDGHVVTMQNGVVEETVAGIVGWGRTVGCIASTLSAEAAEPGHVVRTRDPGGGSYTIFRVGEVHGRITARAEALARMLSAVDSAKVTTNLWGERWSKLVANTMTTAVSGVTGCNLRTVLHNNRTRKLAIRLAAEAIRIGRALGFALEPVRRLEPEVWIRGDSGDKAALQAIDQAIQVELERMTDLALSGTAQDLRKGRRTEVDFMNGYVAAKGHEIGVPAPTHERITELVRQLERGAAKPSPEHALALLA